MEPASHPRRVPSAVTEAAPRPFSVADDEKRSEIGGILYEMG
jgi:hypothetical protein